MSDTHVEITNICGTGEAADVLGVSKQRIHSLRKHPKFPTPIHNISASPLWDKRDLEEFLTIWTPRKKKEKSSEQEVTDNVAA